MINELVKRPSSKHMTNFRPVTGKASEVNQKQSEECFEVGKKHMMKKQYQPALKHYSNAIIHNPLNFKALSNMGLIYKEKGKYNQARNCYSRALFAKPNDHIALYNLGNLERVSGNYDVAIQHYSKVLSLKENENIEIGEMYYNTLINQGICLKNLRLFDEALAFNNKATQVNSNDETAHFNKSMCLLKKIYSLMKYDFDLVRHKICQQAKKSFEKVLSLNPNNFTAKIASVELKCLQNMNEDNMKQALQQFEELKLNASDEQIFEIDIKMQYLSSLLKNIKEKQKMEIQNKKEEKFNGKNENQYDKAKKGKNQIQFQEKQDIVQYENQIQLNNDNVERNRNNDQFDFSQAKEETVEYLPQQKTGEKKEQEIQRQIPLPMSRKALKFSLQVQNYFKEGKTMSEVIDILTKNKKFNEAHQVVQALCQGKQKIENKIILFVLQYQENKSQALLKTALELYNNHIIMNNEQTPITKEICTLRGHQIMATLLNITESFTQAKKHYQILLQLLQDQKNEENKAERNPKSEMQIKDIRLQLGICYAQSGMLKQAIAEYRKSLQEQLDNYFLMTNMCSLLIQDGQQQQAQKYYEEYMKKKGGEDMPDKEEYVDCLLNISICLRNTSGQENAIQKALEAVQKYFPTYQQIKQKLNQTAILGLYLRKADLLQQKYQKSNFSPAQKKQNNERLLQLYLTCLQFEVCPDRELISANTGILFYMNGCYSNALAFFKTITVNRNLVVNNMGLAFLRLQEYEKALTCFQYATQQYPQNIIYTVNFQIVKWICGISGTKVIGKYNCECQKMFISRTAFGLWMLDELTLMIEKNQVQSQNGRDSKNTVDSETRNIITKILEKSERISREKIKQNQKVIFFTKLLDDHMQSFHTLSSSSYKLAPTQILDLCLKKSNDIQQFIENFTKIIEFLKVMKDYEQQYLIIQSLISLTIISNSHLAQSIQTLKDLLIKSQENILTQNVIFLQSKQLKQVQEEGAIQKQVLINYPHVELKVKTLQNIFKDLQCMAQNSMQFILQRIENVYYQNIGSIVSPLDQQYVYPHCESLETCPHCMINSTTLYSSLFCKKIANPQSLGKNQTINQQVQLFIQKFHEFVKKCLQNQQGKIFSKQDKKIKIRIESKNVPFKYVAHHKHFQHVLQFVKGIQQSFSTSIPISSSPKGVLAAIINNCILVQMWWGESITTYDKFYKWLIQRESNLIQDAIFLIHNNIDRLGELFEHQAQSSSKINSLLGIST